MDKKSRSQEPGARRQQKAVHGKSLSSIEHIKSLNASIFDFRDPQSKIRNPKSPICNLKSTIYLPAVTLAQDSRKGKVGEGKRVGDVGLGIGDCGF
jgi:hypothetical protein